MSTEGENSDFPRNDTSFSDYGFPTLKSLDALIEQFDETAQEVQAEIEELKAADDDTGDDAEYWGLLYQSLSFDAVNDDAESVDSDDLGIDKVLAKKETRDTVYYQVKWREHRGVTWERADDIVGARSLLTQFDTYLKKNSRARERRHRFIPGGMSRREKRLRRLEAERFKEQESRQIMDSSRTPSNPPVGAASTFVPAPTPSRVAAPAAVVRQPNPVSVKPPVLKDYSPAEIEKIIARLDAESVACEKNCADLSHRPSTWSKSNIDDLVNVYNEIMTTFTQDKYLDLYGCFGGDESLVSLQPGSSVPSYFANTGSESIWRRKMLSIAGLRNLVIYGREIYSEMKKHRFLGDPEVFGPNEGMNKMRTYTGNVVDLDTTVLRCSDRLTLNAINDWNRHHGTQVWNSTAEFGSSQQAQDIARTAAQTLIEKFISDFKLSEAQQKSRRVHPADIAKTIPVATHNTDRGKHPVWHYTNCGVDSFHANVPSIDDVHGALLRAPLHCLTGWLHAKRTGEIAGFFEDCVVDSCFNMKWKAIEEYNAKHEKQGSINQILDQIQADHQQEFNKIMDDDDDEFTKEKAAMLKHCEGKTGRDKDNNKRSITAADIASWIDDPSKPI
eukprot:TRINITY_DN4507_c5_g1_i1.p1 TRINITY_DN4507_c5_g1~~TRINITY_DN4507_c5_g1_i1.p1  ORF type:complete len:632 (+),score=153.75 TRINITY_DN4507_c5_g1_i1:52-1896(+)